MPVQQSARGTQNHVQRCHEQRYSSDSGSPGYLGGHLPSAQRQAASSITRTTTKWRKYTINTPEGGPVRTGRASSASSNCTDKPEPASSPIDLA